MNYVTADSLYISAGNKELLSDTSVSIEKNSKIGIVGLNGSGKSTLLRCLAGKSSPDAGKITVNSDCTIFMMEQMPDFSPNTTIIDYIFQSYSLPHTDVLREYEYVTEDIAKKWTRDKQERLDYLTAEMEKLNAWDFEGRLRALLSQFGIYNTAVPMRELSGGMIKKISLVQALMSQANLLILDEPTNHLDIDSVLWLESYLQKRTEPVILVTHDRYFLDNACTTIWELDQKRIFIHEGNFSRYLEKKQERLEIEERRNEKRKSILKKEIQWMNTSPSARGTKSRARINRIEDMLKTGTVKEESSAQFSASGRKLGKKILHCKNVSFSYDSTPLIHNFSYAFKAREKIGIVGRNGVGKTTFTRLLTQELSPRSGTVDVGVNTDFGIFTQIDHSMPRDTSVLKYIRGFAEYVTHEDKKISASAFLEQFLFPPRSQRRAIKDLSGGEKRRLQLISVLIQNPNFLILDEPTNDLDIETLAILEDFLLSYTGVVLVISHDRYFVDKVCDYLFILPGDGSVTGFPSSFSDYLLWEDKKNSSEKKEKKKKKESRKKNKPQKLSYKDKRKLSFLEEEIDALETQIDKLEKSFPEADPTDMASMKKEYGELCQKLQSSLQHWEHLSSLEENALSD
ncbi:MAG: ABC-F family ATP-binding cassette domain-containing protein [Fibrobacterota bacterium]